MNIYLPVLLGSLLLGFTASADPLIQPNDRSAFCGDASTANTYALYLEQYLIATQPNITGLDMRQFGWSAESPDVFLTKPGRAQGLNEITKAPFAGHPSESTITFKMKFEDAAKAMNAELARPPK